MESQTPILLDPLNDRKVKNLPLPPSKRLESSKIWNNVYNKSKIKSKA